MKQVPGPREHCQYSLKMDVLALERRVSQLQSELEEKDKDLITAAEFGKKLLDGNQELQNRLEEISKEYTVKIEVCKNFYVVVYIGH